MDINGNLVIEPRFDRVIGFTDGLAAIQSKDEDIYGYIDPTGQILIDIPFEFSANARRSVILDEFYGDLAMVKVDGKYGYVDRAGNFVWEPTN